MALETTQSISINGASVIDGQQVATFSTTVSSEQSYSNVSMQITNQDLYNANKKAVRQDRDDFQDQADEISDGLDSANESQTTTTTTEAPESTETE